MDDEREHQDLTAYETEQEELPPPYSAVAVTVEGGEIDIVGHVVNVAAAPQHASTYTLIVDGDQPLAELLPYDPLRARAIVLVNDAPVVICASRAQAQDAANRAPAVPYPDGMYVPASVTVSTPVELTTIQQMFVAATGSTPARVSVLVERRDP